MENFNNQKIVFSLAGYVVAASMMERVTGKSWEDLVHGIYRKTVEYLHGYSWPNRNDLSAPAGHWYQDGSFHSEDPDTWVKVHPILISRVRVFLSVCRIILTICSLTCRVLLEGKTNSSKSSFEFLFLGCRIMRWDGIMAVITGQSFAFHEGLSLLFNCRTEILKEKDRVSS